MEYSVLTCASKPLPVAATSGDYASLEALSAPGTVLLAVFAAGNLLPLTPDVD